MSFFTSAYFAGRACKNHLVIGFAVVDSAIKPSVTLRINPSYIGSSPLAFRQKPMNLADGANFQQMAS
ncbi:MAG: hypothetical protein K8F91_07885, partial [Candidatus Obscuribacterales bacterium]|nr:hypothetical protein [Candidatus Obscuribacterales bacterium]